MPCHVNARGLFAPESSDRFDIALVSRRTSASMATERCFGVPIAGERFATNALVSSAEVAEHCLVAHMEEWLSRGSG